MTISGTTVAAIVAPTISAGPKCSFFGLPDGGALSDRDKDARNDEYPDQHGRAEHQCQLQPSPADGQPVECIGKDGSGDHR
jgi:hypothetical protein